ncbi:DUF4435 domain-containing protein [Burkholderia contaminans]|nr:DUF4435 domain-containing protein [Burkholderia contaminans]
MLERSSAARYASSVFFERYNDFDVYIEDTAEGYDKIFATLLSRASQSHISLQRVFPLGPRPKVIAAAESELEDKENRGRKSVFVVDGDLYLLCGEFEELPSNVVRLPRYCIENFLFDSSALHDILDDEDANREMEELQRAFDHDGWVTRSTPYLRELFVIFAIAHKLRSGIKTVKCGSSAVCGGDLADVDADKVAAIGNSIMSNLVQNYGQDAVDAMRLEVMGRIDAAHCFVSTYVSGKDFLLPLMIIRLRTLTKTKAPNLNLKLRFAKKCDVSALRDVVKAIGRIVERPDLYEDGVSATAA